VFRAHGVKTCSVRKQACRQRTAYIAEGEAGNVLAALVYGVRKVGVGGFGYEAHVMKHKSVASNLYYNDHTKKYIQQI
jgi:hypothetical protein